MPYAGEFVWSTFWRLSSFRASGMSGPNPITPQDIRGWADMTGTVLRREECFMLVEMDGAYLASCSAENSDAEARRGS